MKTKIIPIITVLLLLIITAETKAQDLYYGVRGGLNVSTLTRTTYSASRIRGNVGIFGGYQINDIVALGAEVLYSWQGSNFTVSDQKLSLNYIKIPILARVFVIAGLNIEAGISFNPLINYRHVNASFSENTTTPSPEMGIRKFDLSIPIGINYLFARHYEFGLRYDISTIRTPTETSNRARNSCLSVNFAYRF